MVEKLKWEPEIKEKSIGIKLGYAFLAFFISRSLTGLVLYLFQIPIWFFFRLFSRQVRSLASTYDAVLYILIIGRFVVSLLTLVILTVVLYRLFNKYLHFGTLLKAEEPEWVSASSEKDAEFNIGYAFIALIAGIILSPIVREIYNTAINFIFGLYVDLGGSRKSIYVVRAYIQYYGGQIVSLGSLVALTIFFYQIFIQHLKLRTRSEERVTGE